MRTIHRDIVGAFIISSDGKILLGNNRKGGVWQDQLVVPGGGVGENETKAEALKREVLEETDLDITEAHIAEIAGSNYGESEKTLRDTGEKVLVKMNIYDFAIHLGQKASAIKLKLNDDYVTANWYTVKDLKNKDIGPATKSTLQKLGYL